MFLGVWCSSCIQDGVLMSKALWPKLSHTRYILGPYGKRGYIIDNVEKQPVVDKVNDTPPVCQISFSPQNSHFEVFERENSRVFEGNVIMY